MESTAIFEDIAKLWAKWRPLLLFGLPMITNIMMTFIAQQILYRPFSSQQTAENEISSFGIAYNLLRYLQACTLGLCNVSILVVWSKKDLYKVSAISLGICCTLVSFTTFVGFTDIGGRMIQHAFDIAPETVKTTKYLVFILSFTLFFEGIFQVLWGLLIQHKHTLFVALCNFLLGGAQVASVFVLIRTSLFHNNLFLIPILSIYIGYTLAFVITVIGFEHNIWKVLPKTSESTVTFQRFFKLYAPLTIVINGWLIGFPLSKAIMANTTVGSTAYITQQLAITSVVIPATRLLVGQQNVIEVTVLTFGKQTNEYTPADYVKLTGFYTGLCLVLVLIFVWIPPVQKWYLKLFMDLPPSLLMKISVPLKILTSYVIVQGAQHLFIGNLLLKEATRLIIIATVIRIILLIGALYILAYCFHIGGALQVTIAVTSCIGAETFVLGVIDCIEEYKLKSEKEKEYFQCPNFPAVDICESTIQTEALYGSKD